jgi:hypothetical protein
MVDLRQSIQCGNRGFFRECADCVLQGIVGIDDDVYGRRHCGIWRLAEYVCLGHFQQCRQRAWSKYELAGVDRRWRVEWVPNHAGIYTDRIWQYNGSGDRVVSEWRYVECDWGRYVISGSDRKLFYACGNQLS